MIVGFNESELLPSCLESVWFSDDIHYTDLGSSDNSVEIAKRYADHVYHRKKVPSCEMIQSEVVNYTKNDWVVFIDPDEVIDPDLTNDLLSHLEEFRNSGSLGAVKVPWQFYFKRIRLNGTIWGGKNEKYLLVNKHRFQFDPIVHYGRKLKPEYSSYTIELNLEKTNVLHHYWMNSYTVFFKKHLRYLKLEPKDRYNLGVRISLKDVIMSPWRSFRQSFIERKGYEDRLLGLFLSVFFAWYQSNVLVRLFFYQRKMRDD